MSIVVAEMWHRSAVIVDGGSSKIHVWPYVGLM